MIMDMNRLKDGIREKVNTVKCWQSSAPDCFLSV